jgi:hypothetical protein
MPDIPTTSNGKQWGRRWKVTVKSLKSFQPAGFATAPYLEVFTIEQNEWTPEGLHIKFDTTQATFQWQWCDVIIYNLNAPTSQSLIQYGMTCQVEAGYMNGPYGTVFYGTIFQPLWEKENGVDWKLTLHCVVGMIEGSNNFIGHTVAGGVNQRDMVAQMIGQATTPLQLDLSGMEDTDNLTRATTYFGQPNDLLQYAADSNDALTWFNDRKAYVLKLTEDNTVPEKEFGTDNGLIGTPQQTEFGVALRVLLQPDLVLRGQIKLKQSVAIKQMLREIGTRPSIITQDYRYIIGKLRHIGDSRGNDWYTEITGYYNADALLAQLQTR